MDEMDVSRPAGREVERQINVILFDGLDQPDWQERALCAQTDPEAFFPEKGGSTREAKRICAGCEVRAECLEYALAFDERFGIWGGLSERERRRLKRGAV
jgi:WhiB family redox-sensing transcriptional regulator